MAGLFRTRRSSVPYDEQIKHDQDWKAYDRMRGDDEDRGHVKPTSYTGQRIAKKTTSKNPETPKTSVDITQETTVPPDDEHDKLMKRVG